MTATPLPARVVVVVPVFNRLATTRQCLDDLRRQTWPNLKVVLVDGGSTDGTPATVRRDYPEVTVYADRGDLWWTHAVALAVQEETPGLAASDYVFLVNNDTVLRPDSIERLVATSRCHGDAVVAATVREVAGHLVAAGSRMHWSISLGHPVGYDEEEFRGREVLPADVVFGRATLVPVACFAAVGNFDGERYPQYFGDSDFFLRVSRAGIPVLIDCRTEVGCREDEANTGVHFVQQSRVTLARVRQMLTSRRSNLNLPDGWRFIWQHAPKGRKLFCLANLTWQNGHTVAALYLGQYWVFRQLARIPAAIRRTWYRILCWRVLRLQPKYMTFPELRRFGFDPVAMLRDGDIERSGIPHTYSLMVPRRRIFGDWSAFGPLVLRHADPRVIWRIRRFCRAWVKKHTERERMRAF